MGTLTDAIRNSYPKSGVGTLLGRLICLATASDMMEYYLYECRLDKWKEADFLPRIRDFSLKTVRTPQELDALQAEGFDVALDFKWTRRGLEKGAVAFLLFVGKELASRELVATNAAAKAIVDPYPYRVDFEHQEACAAAVWTNPKFRRRGFHSYVFFKAYDYLRQDGRKVVRSIVWAENTAAQRSHQKFAPNMRKYARGRYLKILGCGFHKESPL